MTLYLYFVFSGRSAAEWRPHPADRRSERAGHGIRAGGHCAEAIRSSREAYSGPGGGGASTHPTPTRPHSTHPPDRRPPTSPKRHTDR